MTLKEFYPIYLEKHSKLGTKLFHVFGLVCAYAVLACAILADREWYALAAPMIGYFWAFSGHFFIEGNTPATFGEPVLSFICDHKMFLDLIRGKFK